MDTSRKEEARPLEGRDLEAYLEEQRALIESLRGGRRVYATMALVLTAVAAIVAIAACVLAASGAIGVVVQGRLMFISVLVLVIVAVVYFSGLRPVRRKIAAAEKRIAAFAQQAPEPQESQTGDSAAQDAATPLAASAAQTAVAEAPRSPVSAAPEDGDAGELVDRLAKRDVSSSLDDFFKIFERKARNPLVPKTAEYQRLRGVWRALVGAALALMAAALVLYALMPASALTSGLILAISYGMLVLAFVYDRKMLKPLRNEWAAKRHLSEFEARHDFTTTTHEDPES